MSRSSASASRRLVVVVVVLVACLACSPAAALRLKSPDYTYIGSGQPAGILEHTFALFAPDPLTYNVNGSVWHNPANATFCSGVSSSDATALAGNIVLSLRGGCQFKDKAILAQRLGASALIIGDSDPANLDFVPKFLWPTDALVNIPVIFVLSSTYQQLVANEHWKTTTATINQDGLAYTLEDYATLSGSASAWDSRMRTFFNLSPFLVVAFCYWAFYQTYRGRQRQAAAAQPQAQQQPQAAQDGAPAAVGSSPVVVDVAPSPSPLPASGFAPVAPSSFSERDMSSLSLPVPPHLSDDAPTSLSDVALEAAPASRSGRSGSVDEGEHKECEGLMGPNAVSSSSSSSNSSASRASGSNSRVSSSSPRSEQVQALDHPLLPSPSVASHMRCYYHLLQFLAALGKPRMILRVNAVMYAFHVVCAIYVLIKGWDERCANENLAISVSLWAARALIGFRIVFWQTHSNDSIPTCVDVFFKNWSDCIFLFTGSMFTWNAQQRTDCELNAPTVYSAIRFWVILIYCTYGGRILLYMFDRYSQRHSATLSHLFTISTRTFLTMVNGGFSCAGPLDKDQPATQLDLMLIPTATFVEGMYPVDDAICGVCLTEYAAGETLRVLNCSHHFHQACVDTWLLQKSNCPTCRASLNDRPANRRAAGSGPRAVIDIDDDEERGDVEMQERPPPPSQQRGYRPEQQPEPL